MQPLLRFLAALALGLCSVPALHAGLSLVDLGHSYQRNPAVTPIHLFHADSNLGGSTSVRRAGESSLIWKDDGYYQRNRDIGQVFSVPQGTSITLDAIVLRTGNSSAAILANTPGASVYLQIFEVSGSPWIHDNGTPVGTSAKHGFTTNHRADDYIQGVTYQTLRIAEGGTFPNIPPTTQNGGQAGHLRFIRWDLTGSDEITLQGGKRYAFMVGFIEGAANRGFTLGNANDASNTAAPALKLDPNGKAWWSIRREGDGTLPPTEVPGPNPPADSALNQKLKNESLFASNHRTALSPTTDGYPDVDTYRTLEFYVETKTVTNPAEITLVPNADAYVRAGVHANNNQHSGNGTSELKVKDSLPDYTRISYIRFPLGSLAGVAERALLTATVRAIGTEGSGDRTVQVHKVNSDAWTETGITYNNRPGTGSLLGQLTFTAAGQTRTLDLTSTVNAERAGDQQLTLAFVQPLDQNRLVEFNSREVGAGVVLAVTPSSSTPSGGLRGEYFSNNGLSGSPAVVRTDATVNFGWGSGSPASSIGSDNFSARWSGDLIPSASGAFRFQTESDDGVRLWVNGVQLINNWTDHAPTTDTSGSITLTAGQRYALRMEYFERGGGAVARLRWFTPGTSSAVVIPSSALAP